LIAVDDPDFFDRTLVNRRWGRRSEKFLYGSLKGEDDRFGTLTDGTPYDMVFMFDDMGYNFEPSEIMAAYGLVQLDKLADFNAWRRRTWNMLDELLSQHEELVVRPRTTPDIETTWMRFPFLLADGINRNEVQEFLLARGVPTRMIWTGNILRQPGFADIPHRQPEGGLPNTDRVMERGLSLPSHNALTSDDVGHIVESVEECLHAFG
jgi:CDP-6-deoxy-D-xylo-4-hexulose-3-dehydrase